MEMLSLIAAAYFATCVLVASAWDVRALRIPNALVIALAAGAPIWHLGVGTGWLINAGLGAVVLLGLGFLLYASGSVGGGDAKMAAAVALWLAPAEQAVFLLFSALIGGLLAALILAFPRAALAVGTAREGPRPMGATSVPYGVALAAGGLFAFPWGAI